MRRLICTWSLLLVAVPGGALAEPAGGEAARQVVDRFGRALVGGETTELGSILPQRGKVTLKLVRLGPEEGSFSANQVVALLREFLAAGQVEGFTVTRVEHHPNGVAHAAARVELIDKQGHRAAVALHLALHAEDDRWVVREIRETTQ